jgi:hypothetical protein
VVISAARFVNGIRARDFQLQKLTANKVGKPTVALPTVVRNVKTAE